MKEKTTPSPNKIQFVDQTIRDAQQSLWGLMMRTDMILPIAETMDRVGYLAIATVGSQAFKVQIRNFGENPWERIRLLSGLLKKTPIRGSYQIGSLSSFDLSTPREIISLWIKRSVANGMKSFWICDYQDSIEKFEYFARIAKGEGATITTSLMYATSPVHTEEHWAQKCKVIAAEKDLIDGVMIEDASGIMTPEGARKIVKIVRKHCDGIPIEMHCHSNSGMAIQCYLEAIQEGVTTVHTAVAPLANGHSLPPTETILKNIRYLGFDSDIDEDALAKVSEHFRNIAKTSNLPLGVPQEYDLFHFQHQVPGGMISNLKRQLREVNMEDQIENILHEIIQVRKELGYPVMATPYSQIVGIQAMENVVSGKRYDKIPDEVIKYVDGQYGKVYGPIADVVTERIEQLPQAAQLKGWKPENYEKSIAEFRAEIGPDLDDDDLILSILIPGYDKDNLSKPPMANAAPPTSPSLPTELPDGLPTRFNVDVDGETFSVSVEPVWGEGTVTVRKKGTPVEKTGPKPEKIPEGAVIPGFAGLLVSLTVKVGDRVNEGDQIAVIEAMKLMKNYLAPHGGMVKEIFALENSMIDTDTILMVIN